MSPTCSLLALFTLALPILVEDPPCVPEGGSSEVEFERPELDEAGDPAGAEWTGEGGDPEAFDEDVASDDSMGDADSEDGGSTATVTVENEEGDLSGPNGEVVNGGLDGDCAEVYVEWTYRYPARVTTLFGTGLNFDFGIFGQLFNFSRAVTVTVWAEGTKRDGPKEVCPC